MDARGKTVTVLALGLSDAVLKDEAPEEGGFDLSAGMFGRNVSDWVRATARELDDRAAEVTKLRSMLAGGDCGEAGHDEGRCGNASCGARRGGGDLL